MKKRDIVGRRITDVVQIQQYNSYFGRRTNSIVEIVLDNGTRLIPQISPTDDEASDVDFVVVKRR